MPWNPKEETQCLQKGLGLRRRSSSGQGEGLPGKCTCPHGHRGLWYRVHFVSSGAWNELVGGGGEKGQKDHLSE